MENIEFVPVAEHRDKYGITVIRDVKLKVDIQLGDTIYKDAVITIPESTLEHIVGKYETKHSW